MAAVEVRDLVIRYGDVLAVAGLSFDARAGEVCCLLGPNGAGKTSTVETLEGFRVPAAGSVRVLGLDPRRDHPTLVRRVGVMLQGGGVYPGVRVREVLELFAAFYDDAVAVDDLLALVGLTERARATWRQLSGGEQQRLSLALALVGRPEVVFLDEPTSGVDVTGRQVIRKVVRDLAERGVGVLVTTHELAEAERMADRLVIIDRGRVVATGTPAELAGGDERFEFGAPAALDVGALAAVVGGEVRETEPGRYEVDRPAEPQRVAALTAWLAERDAALTDLRTGRSLEATFLALVTSSPAPASPPERKRARRR